MSYSLAEATGTVNSDIFLVWVVGILGMLDWSGGESEDENFFGQLEMKDGILANGIWRCGSRTQFVLVFLYTDGVQPNLCKRTS